MAPIVKGELFNFKQATNYTEYSSNLHATGKMEKKIIDI